MPALLLAAHMASSLAAAQAPASGKPLDDHSAAVARKAALSGISNFAQVTPTLYRGGQPTASGFQALQQLGIAIVVNFRGENSEAEQRIVTHLGMQYVSLPWSCRHPSNELVGSFLQLLRDNPGKKIFIHCRYGVDRTGLMIAAYRMAMEGWTPAQAFAEMVASGFDYWHSFACHAVKTYEEGFPAQLHKDSRLNTLQPPTPTTAP